MFGPKPVGQVARPAPGLRMRLVSVRHERAPLQVAGRIYRPASGHEYIFTVWRFTNQRSRIVTLGPIVAVSRRFSSHAFQIGNFVESGDSRYLLPHRTVTARWFFEVVRGAPVRLTVRPFHAVWLVQPR